MKRRSQKTAQQLRTLQPASSSAELAVTTAPAAAAAGSGRQRCFTAKRALEMLQNLPDTDSGSSYESQTDDDDDNSSVHLSQASSEDDDDNDDDEVASESDA